MQCEYKCVHVHVHVHVYKRDHMYMCDVRVQYCTLHANYIHMYVCHMI